MKDFNIMKCKPRRQSLFLGLVVLLTITNEFFLGIIFLFYLLNSTLVFLLLVRLYTTWLLKRASLSYFRVRSVEPSHKWRYFIMQILIVLVILGISYKGLLPDSKFSRVTSITNLLIPLPYVVPLLFFYPFVASIVVYKQGIQLNVMNSSITVWKEIQSLKLDGDFIVLGIIDIPKKRIRFHPFDKDDVLLLMEVYAKNRAD